MFAALAIAAVVLAPPQRWVTDDAAALSRNELSQLDAKLEALERRTGHQVVVYVGKTLGQQPIEDFAVRTFGQWQVGRKGLDDGAALFVFVDDRVARIEVGYGLEPTLTDAACARIIREVLAPRMKAGDTGGALDATVDAISSQLGGGPAPPPDPQQVIAQQKSKLVVIGIAVLAFIILAFVNPRFAFFVLMMLGRGGGGWGGNRKGGGFSGGGGRSGGGGATGHW